MMEFTIKNLGDLPEVSEEIVKNIQHKTIAFDAEMGAGKTTLIKELAKILGVKEEVSSPTFSLVNEYSYQEGKIYHFDFYRIKTPEEALDIGWEDYLYSGNHCWIEWANLIQDYLPEEHHTIKIKVQDSIRLLEFH